MTPKTAVHTTTHATLPTLPLVRSVVRAAMAVLDPALSPTAVLQVVADHAQELIGATEATVSLTSVADLNNSSTGTRLGGGLVYWGRPRIGLRLDAFAFFPARDDIKRFSTNTTPHYWGIRAGLAFRVH